MHEFPQMRSSRPTRPTGRGGFTLIEILIVLGIVLLMTALVMGTITRLGANNRRMHCQTNLTQIYQAARLYQQDEGGFPFYDESSSVTSLERNIGLWALYAFPKATSVSAADPKGPIGRYLRSPNVLHCPQDNDPAENGVGVPSLLTDSGTNFNSNFLSYQKNDGSMPAYQSIRTTNPAHSDWKRQLTTFNGTNRVFRTPADNTIVTWCRFHRKAVGGRDFDNVLFYDGSVQLLPRQQDDGSLGWQRLPKAPV